MPGDKYRRKLKVKKFTRNPKEPRHGLEYLKIFCLKTAKKTEKGDEYRYMTPRIYEFHYGMSPFLLAVYLVWARELPIPYRFIFTFYF